MKYNGELVLKLREAALRGESLETIASIAETSKTAIIMRIRRFKKQDPENWTEDIVSKYESEYYQTVIKEKRRIYFKERKLIYEELAQIRSQLIDLIILLLDKEDMSIEQIKERLQKVFGVDVKKGVINKCVREYNPGECLIGRYNGKLSLKKNKAGDYEEWLTNYIRVLKNREINNIGGYDLNRKILDPLLEYTENET